MVLFIYFDYISRFGQRIGHGQSRLSETCCEGSFGCRQAEGRSAELVARAWR